MRATEVEINNVPPFPQYTSKTGYNFILSRITMRNPCQCGKLSPQLHINMMTGAINWWVFFLHHRQLYGDQRWMITNRNDGEDTQNDRASCNTLITFFLLRYWFCGHLKIGLWTFDGQHDLQAISMVPDLLYASSAYPALVSWLLSSSEWVLEALQPHTHHEGLTFFGGFRACWMCGYLHSVVGTNTYCHKLA